MTLEKAIFLADERTPNLVERARKIEWLNTLDKWVWDQVICRHVRRADTPESFTAYTQNTDQDTQLLAPEPYDEMYPFYLEMQIALCTREYEQYNAAAQLYMAARGRYSRDYHRRHRPINPLRHMRF